MDCRPLRSVLNQCVLLVTILVLVQPAFASSWKSDATTSQFKDWYPQYGFVFERAMNQNCTDQYNSYSTRVKNTSMIDWYGGGDVPSALTQPVILCILDSTSDYIKSASTYPVLKPGFLGSHHSLRLAVIYSVIENISARCRTAGPA